MLFLTIILLFTQPIVAVPGENRASLSGMVRDASTGKTLDGAHVYISGTANGVVSDSRGHYQLPGLKAHSYTLNCTFVGYQFHSQSISLEPGENVKNIYLTPSNTYMKEIVVNAEPRDIMRNPGFKMIEPVFLHKIPAVFESDLFRSLQFLPGIKSSSDLSSGLRIRGGSPDQTLILLDDIPVYNPTHFMGFYSVFNPDVVGKVKLYKGNYPVQYGGRLGSVLEVHQGNDLQHNTGGRFTIGLLASRLRLEGPIGNASWMIAARRSTLGPTLSLLRSESNNFDIPDQYHFYDLNGRMDIPLPSSDKLKLTFYSGSDHMHYPIATDASMKLDYGNLAVAGHWSHILDSQLLVNTSLSVSRYFNRPLYNMTSTLQQTDNNLSDYIFKSDLHYLVDDQNELETGIVLGLLDLEYQNHFNGKTTYSLSSKHAYSALYLQHRWHPKGKWSLSSGIRVNSFSSLKQVRINPRVKLGYQWDEHLELQTGYGRYQQFSTLVSRQISGFDFWLTSGNGVKPSKGSQFFVGLKSTPFPHIHFNTEFYYRTMDYLFELDPYLQGLADLSYRDIFQIGSGRARGIELQLEKKTGPLQGFIGYNLSLSTRQFPGINGGRPYPAPYNRTHEVDIVVNYKLNAHWKATATFNYASGQPYTKPSGRYYRLEGPAGYRGTTILTVQNVNGARLPDYQRLDIGITRTGSFFKLGRSELTFQIINVYSHRNVWYIKPGINRGNVKYHTATMLPLIPSLAYTVNF